MPGGDARPFATFVEESRSLTAIVYRSSRAFWLWLMFAPGLAVFVFVRLAVTRGPILPVVPFIGSFTLLWMVVIWTNSVIHARLLLDLKEGRVHYRERLWTGRIARWSLSKADVAHVSLRIDARGVGVVEVARRDAGPIVVDWGNHIDPLQKLAADLARCWGVPLRT
jgi:hypothetical protein